MQKWEYLVAVYRFDDEIEDWVFEVNDKTFDNHEDLFSELGINGWELVSTSTFIGSSNYGAGVYANTKAEYFYFKRPIGS